MWNSMGMRRALSIQSETASMRTRRLEVRRHRPHKAAKMDAEEDPDDVPQYFQVTVSVIEARKLAWAKPQSATSYVIVVLDRKKHRTGVRRNMEEPYYGENFVFDLHTSTRDMQRYTLCFAVMEARCGPPRLLGEASVDLSAVWTQPHHTVSRKWAQLSLTRNAAAGPTGYLKVDISILFKGQFNSPIPYDDKIEDNLLLPSGSEQQRACYQVIVYAAYALPSSTHCHVEKNSKPPSTFVRVTFSGLVAKTSVQARSHNPAYSEQVTMVEMFPNICQMIRLEVCSADGFSSRVLASTHLTLTKISHCVENGFLPTFGPSLLHMYGSWCSGALSVGEDGPYHRGALLVALRTVVPYSKHHLRTVSVKPIPPLNMESLWILEEFCVYCSIFEVSMLDSRISGKHCGVAITMGAVSTDDMGDPEFTDLVSTIKQSKLHYTGSMNIYNSSPALGYLEFSNEFPVLQLAARLPDFRFRMYRNNMVYGIIADFEKELLNVEARFRCLDYDYPGELIEQLNAMMVDVSAKILKFLDITLHSMFEGNRCSTELDIKQMRLQKEEIEKIYQRLSKKAKASSISLLTGSKWICNSEDSSKRGVKLLLAQARMVLQDLNCLIFETSVGWPDIVLWMLSSGSRVAYAKIAPTDIVYSVIPEQRGRAYGQVHTVYLKPIRCPKNLNAECRCDCIAAKVELLAWLGPHRQRACFESSLPGGFNLNSKETGMYIKCMPLVVECRVYVYRAKLSVGDSATVSPCVRVNFMNAVQETQVQQKSVSPLWSEVIKINRNVYSTPQRLMGNPPEVLVEVYDKEDANRKGFLGRVQLVPKTSERDESPPALQWLELFKGTEQAGRILMSAQLIQMPELLIKTTYYDVLPAGKSMHGPGRQEQPPTLPEPIPRCLIPVLSSYKVDVYWWGLRDVSVAHKPCMVLELDDVTIKSCIIMSATASCNFPEGKTSQMFEGDLSESLCSPLSVKLYDSSTFGRTLFVGLNVVRNPLKYMINWIPKHEREESLHSTSFTSRNFVQVNHALFVKKINRSYSDHDSLSSTSSSGQQRTAKVSLWRRIFRKDIDEEQYTLLPVFNKKEQLKPTKSSPEEKDWWMRYIASQTSNDDDDRNTDDRFEIYGSELEAQPGFSKFKDWCSMLKIYNGTKTGIPEKDDQLQCGYLKIGLVIYKWPPPENTVAVSPNGVELDRGYFADHPDNEPAKFLVRVYVIKAFDLADKGFTTKSEPYVVVQCGRKVVGDKTSPVPKTANQVFGKMFEFRCSLPEDYQLRISLLERNASPPEDLIGFTTLDLEDRVYTKHRACVGLPKEYHTCGPSKWCDIQKPSAILEELCLKNHLPPPAYPDSSTVLVNNVEYKDFEHVGTYTSKSDMRESICLNLLHQWHTLPICGHPLVPEHVETRALYNPDKPVEEQGKIHLWVNIFPLDCGPIPSPVDITPRPMEEFELRVIVWDVQGVKLHGNKACDIYVKAWIGASDEAQDTDIHYHSVKGEGCFNWRMVFHFHYQHTEGKLVLHEKGPFTEVLEHFPPILIVQVQDSEAANPEDFLGTLTLNMTSMPRGSRLPRPPDVSERRRISLFVTRGARAWWPLRTLDRSTGRYYAAGMIDLELTLLPKEKALLTPVGLGREPPSPLPKPKRPKPVKLRWNMESKYKLSRDMKMFVVACFCVMLLLVLLSFFFFKMDLRDDALDSVLGLEEYNKHGHHPSSGNHRIRRKPCSSLHKLT